ncbi:MAG TPA: hypothetical protein DC046_06880 [Rhodospirillaceae bacterium]|nr:hypothetical protein [Rhodospirillaceae bacterium]
MPSVPVFFLTAHAIELILKSYLRHCGLTLKQLRNLGHDLEKAWNAASKRGVQELVVLSESEIQTLAIISKLHASAQLRYIVTGYKTVPTFGALQDVAVKLLNAIGPEVGYRSYEDDL